MSHGFLGDVADSFADGETPVASPAFTAIFRLEQRPRHGEQSGVSAIRSQM